ncbi:MAG TPA: sulfite exporter TauE/SafE family protein [Candidatus Saccharimonadales bacterium]|nr:sulfite exporter TauE/SafE family protein [Candidatus Saccharimonadales bacterium]
MHTLELLVLSGFIIINALAGFFQGVVGFGQGLVATPLSLTFLDKNTVLPAMVVVGLLLNLSLSKQIKEPLDNKIFKPLLIGSVLGMPFGVLILKLLSLSTLRISVGVLSIVLTIAIVFVKFKARHLRVITPITGFVSGVLQTSTSIPGPPVVLLLAGSGATKNAMRKILVVYFFWISVIALPLYLIGGILTWKGVLFGLCATPAIVGAGYLGNKVAHHVPHKWYRVLALVTVCATGAFAIYSGIR